MISEETTKKCIKNAGGGIVYSAGVAAKLADWGLNAAEVVLNGAVNLANSFVKVPNLGIGKSLLDTTHKCISKTADYCLKKGKELLR